ncbi:hypothetical protein BXZ70DRAFT_801790 [Cristinia sonorae]|uniref:Uncharacterized protein n=1 Tax=Cristinia sonorae TaxID=1940300 RepID=A0A8K0UT26_9AGAR|nr:hypothetical protein BXZ70DRAFT_801790 [Cristinia sonorae]
MAPIHQSLIALISAYLVKSVSGHVVNVTVDDQLGDERTGIKLNYFGHWNPGPGCGHCLVIPDSTRAHSGTWQDIAFKFAPPPTYFTFTFSGTAIYAYVILSSGRLTHAELSVDGSDPTLFIQSYDDPTTPFLYDIPAFSLEGLENKQHTITFRAGWSGSGTTITLFDYLVYTTDEPDTGSDAHPAVQDSPSVSLPQPTSSDAHGTDHRTLPRQTTASQKGGVQGQNYQLLHAAIGATVGGVLLVVVAIVLLSLYFRHRKQKHTRYDIEPYYEPPQPILDACDPKQPPLTFAMPAVEARVQLHRRSEPTFSLQPRRRSLRSPDQKRFPLRSSLPTTPTNPPSPLHQNDTIQVLNPVLASHMICETRPSRSDHVLPSTFPNPVISSVEIPNLGGKELARLRAEVKELRTQQHPLQRELHMMRMQINDLRDRDQEGLPEYTPPLRPLDSVHPL